MKMIDALASIAVVTASQWGMITAAQANALGINRLTLVRLTEAKHLERIAHGIYKDARSPSDNFEELRAAWLSTEPKILAEKRIKNLNDGVIVAGTSAAQLHGIGDFWVTRHEFVAPKRRQTQRTEIRYRQRELERRDITLVRGLPVMTPERTIADLLTTVGDLSLVADALKDAVKNMSLDFNRLRELLAPFAERNGFKKFDGNALLERLLEIAGLDLDSVAQRIAADSELTSKIVEIYLNRNKEQGAEITNLGPSPGGLVDRIFG